MNNLVENLVQSSAKDRWCALLQNVIELKSTTDAKSCLDHV